MERTGSRWSRMGLMALAGFTAGCGGGGGETTPAPVADINQSFLVALAANNYMAHADAQPPADLYVPARHFALVSSSQPLAAGTPAAAAVLYRPAYAVAATAGVRKAALLPQGAGGEEIPGFKATRGAPAGCSGLVDEALKTCLDAAGAQLAPAAAHTSFFDADALQVLLGEAFAGALVDKVLASVRQNVDATRRAQVLATLTDYIDDAPAHRSLDLAQQAVFERAGYRLTGVTFTDAGRADIDADGVLESHTTVIVQVSKQLAYLRSAADEVDGLLRQADGQLPAEPYVVQLQAHIHLANFDGVRQAESAAVPDAPTTPEADAARDRARWMNQAMDANILRRLVEAPGIIPWASSEYIVSFQLAPQAITGPLGDALARAAQNGDDAGVQALEQHLNAGSAILTSSGTPPAQASAAPVPGGAGVDVFYQAAQPRSAAARWSGANLEYAMFDAAGNRVALADPATGTPMLAGEPRLATAANGAPLKLTKPGSCQNDSSGWSYYPAKVQTGRFGRGINWILPELLVHNQVGDYKNIHWYQSAWKASAQTAIKSGMWIVANYLKTQFAGQDFDKSTYGVLYLLEVVFPYVNSFLSDRGNGRDGRVFRIAGWSYQIDSKIVRFFGALPKSAKEGWGDKAKNAGLGFMIDRISDGVGQTLDVTVTGWEDYSDGSHYGCFQFSY